MSKFGREILAAVVMIGVLSGGCFAQKGKDKRPPKEPVKVIDGKGGSNKPPPPQKPKDDKKKP